MSVNLLDRWDVFCHCPVRSFLYVAAELVEPKPWATLREHDSVIFHVTGPGCKQLDKTDKSSRGPSYGKNTHLELLN